MSNFFIQGGTGARVPLFPRWGGTGGGANYLRQKEDNKKRERKWEKF